MTSDETPVERRLRLLHDNKAAFDFIEPDEDADAIDCGREAIRLLREAEATEDGGVSDEEYAAMMGRVRALLTTCREDGR